VSPLANTRPWRATAWDGDPPARLCLFPKCTVAFAWHVRSVKLCLLAHALYDTPVGGETEPEPNRGRTETTTTTGLAGPSPHATTRSRSRHQARPRKRSCRLSHLSRPDLVRLGVRKPRDAPPSAGSSAGSAHSGICLLVRLVIFI
jgi:hypothetical protein